MVFLDELKEFGVDVDTALERLGGKTSFYEKLLGKFYNMLKEYEISPDFDNGDCKGMIEKTHAIKGVAGNLAMTPLYNAYTEIVELLREEKPEQAKERIQNILPLQAEIMQCIEKHMQ